MLKGTPKRSPFQFIENGVQLTTKNYYGESLILFLSPATSLIHHGQRNDPCGQFPDRLQLLRNETAIYNRNERPTRDDGTSRKRSRKADF